MEFHVLWAAALTYHCGGSRSITCGAFSGFCSLPPPLCFPLCISVTGACLLVGVGAHGWVVRFCQPSMQSPSWSWLQIVEAPGCLRHSTCTERRSCLLQPRSTCFNPGQFGAGTNTGHRSLFNQYRNNPNHLQVLTLSLKTFA